MFPYIVIIFLIISVVGGCTFMRAQYGENPSDYRLERIQKSSNYRNGSFQNLIKTPMKTGEVSYWTMLKKYLFNKGEKSEPLIILPSVKTNLHALNPDKDLVVWFGHSSYFIQIAGKRILVDPVLSGNASPVSFAAKSYRGSDIYTAEDFPEIDYLLISHDHWDHLDFETVKSLKPKIKKVIAGLGTGSHVEYWGYDADMIIERDWFEEAVLDEGLSILVMPARHFSGRVLRGNRTLWASFVINTPSKKIFISGDTGYGTHFREIGDRYGPFDLAILECGQYNESWSAIHMMPEQTVQAAIDLKATTLLPSHWSKFSLSLHDWDEPIIRVTEESTKRNITVVHPLIGEAIDLYGKMNTTAWWEAVR